MKGGEKKEERERKAELEHELNPPQKKRKGKYIPFITQRNKHNQKPGRVYVCTGKFFCGRGMDIVW